MARQAMDQSYFYKQGTPKAEIKPLQSYGSLYYLHKIKCKYILFQYIYTFYPINVLVTCLVIDEYMTLIHLKLHKKLKVYYLYTANVGRSGVISDSKTFYGS